MAHFHVMLKPSWSTSGPDGHPLSLARVLPLLSNLIEDTSIVKLSNLLLLHTSVLRPKKDIRRKPCKGIKVSIAILPLSSNSQSRHTLERRRRSAKRIGHHPLPLEQVPHVPQGDKVLVVGVLGEHVLELLRHEAALAVVRAGVAAVLGLVDVLEVDAEEGVGEIAGDGRVGEGDVDDDGGEEAEEDVPAYAAEASVCVQRPDDAVFVLGFVRSGS